MHLTAHVCRDGRTTWCGRGFRGRSMRGAGLRTAEVVARWHGLPYKGMAKAPCRGPANTVVRTYRWTR